MTLLLRGRTSIPDGVMIRQLGDESVLLNLNSEAYFGLDDVGTRMWMVLAESPSVAAAYERLLMEYDVAPEQLGADLQAFIVQLVEFGLISVKHDD